MQSYIASDVPAILKYTRNVYYIGNMEIACCPQRGDYISYNVDGEEIEQDTEGDQVGCTGCREGRLRAFHDERDPRAAKGCEQIR